MALAVTIIAFYLLSKRLDAGPVPAPSSTRPCVEFQLPVAVTAQNAEYDLIKFDTNRDATAFAVDIDTWSYADYTQRLLRNFTVSDTFQISAQLCIPSHGTKKDHLQIATHGLAFDKRYWDATINPSEYSYVEAALAAGYSILTYDRLGTGLSDKPDAYTVVQAPLELEILRKITEMSRDGDLLKHLGSAHNKTTSKSTLDTSGLSFNKVIHVGHSFGSFLTSALLSTYGNISDAAIITGYIPNPHFADLRWTTFGAEYAPLSNPKLFGDRSAGYLAVPTTSALQTGFFSTRANATEGVGGFDDEALDYAFSIAQTIAAAEIPSPSQLNLGPALGFNGFVQFVVAEYDFLVCRGDCSEALTVDQLKLLYPKAQQVDKYVQLGTGHGLTLHKGARSGYEVSLDWLNKNGL